MPTLYEQRAAVAANQAEREADFEAWQYHQRLRDEITDQAERLAAPMENTFEYALTPEGLHTDLGELLMPIFDVGLQVAEHNAKSDPRWQFEAARRRIEREEMQELTAFAQQTRSGIRITTLSLDRSDYAGMQAIATVLGYELPVERPGSEDILRNRLWLGVPPGVVILSPIPDAVRLHGIDIGAYDRERQKMLVRVATLTADTAEEHKNVVGVIRDAYDDALHRQFGGEWFAGRNAISVKDATEFISQQKDLLDEHMKIVQEVYAKTSDKQERLKLLEPHRYNLAAALDDRLHGKSVGSLAESGDAARAEGRTFSGDCPTTLQPQTAAQQIEALGYSVATAVEKLKCVNCPFCKRIVDAIKKNQPNEKTIECQRCFAKVDLITGERIDKMVKRVSKTMGAAAIRAAKKAAGVVKSVVINGTAFRREERLVVGGTVSEYVNEKTGEHTQM